MGEVLDETVLVLRWNLSAISYHDDGPVTHPAWENDVRSGWFNLGWVGLVWDRLVSLREMGEGETDGTRYREAMD